MVLLLIPTVALCILLVWACDTVKRPQRHSRP